MEEEPFAAMVEAVRREAAGTASSGLCMGRVTSWPTALAPGLPQKVFVGGNTQEREALRIRVELSPYGIKAGDEVLMLPIEAAQRYVIVCGVADV